MPASQYPVAGPLARAVESCSPAASVARRRNAADVLAGMLDLQASVKLADCLGPPPRPPADVNYRTPLLLGDYVRKRLASIEEAAARRLTRPFDGLRIRVADPLRLFAQLVSADATKSPDSARAFASTVWTSYRDFLMASVIRARAEVAEVRDEVAPDLRDAGPRAAKLEAFDNVVRGALKNAVPELCERLVTAMEPPFIATLTAAIERLTDMQAVDASAIAPWFGERAVLGAQLARTTEITRTLLAHEARSLATLVDAACNGGAT